MGWLSSFGVTARGPRVATLRHGDGHQARNAERAHAAMASAVRSAASHMGM